MDFLNLLFVHKHKVQNKHKHPQNPSVCYKQPINIYISNIDSPRLYIMTISFITT